MTKESKEPKYISVQPFPFLVRLLARNNAVVAHIERELALSGLDYTKETAYRKFLYLRSASLSDELRIRKVFCLLSRRDDAYIESLLRRFYKTECRCSDNARIIKEYLDDSAFGMFRLSHMMERAAIYMFLHVHDEVESPDDVDQRSSILIRMMYEVENWEIKPQKKQRPALLMDMNEPLDLMSEVMGLPIERHAVMDVLRSENLLLDTIGTLDLSKSDNKIISSCFSDILFANHNGITPSRYLALAMEDSDKIDYQIENAAADYADMITYDEEDEKSLKEFTDKMMPHYFYLNVIKRLAKAYSRAKETYFRSENELVKKKEANSWQRKYEECLKEKNKLETSVSSKVEELQRKLNELQLAFDKKKLALTDAEAEIDLLKQGLTAFEEAAEKPEQETDEPPKETDSIGDGEGVLLFGGHERFQQKYERLFPKIRTFSPDQDFDANVIKGARIVCINAYYMPHKQFFKIIGEVRKHKKKIMYVK